MFIIIFQFILFISLAGIVLIMVRKIPVLIALPEIIEEPIEKKRLWKRIKKVSYHLAVKPYKSKELKAKIAKQGAQQDQANLIDTDDDYWQNIRGH